MTREEAIEKVRQWSLPKDTMEILEALVPELRESEDERIRKEIIKTISWIVPDCQYAIVLPREQKDKWLAWLEKQKEPTTEELYAEAGTTEKEYIANTMKMVRVMREKQKEQKPILEVFGFKVGDAVRLKDGDGRKHIIKSFEEVEGIHGSNFYHVEFEDNSARDGIYPGEEYPNGYYTQMEKFEEEQKPSTPKYRVGDVMRTKQEAAEGITDGLPVIVSMDDDYYYCTNEKISISEQEEYEFPPMNMRQKPAEPSDEELQRHQDELYDFKVFAARQAREHHISFVHDFEWNNFCAELLSYFNEKQKPAEWSEEDETRLTNILIMLKEYVIHHYSKDDVNKSVDWLENRVKFLRPVKQEWSEEDEEMIERLIRHTQKEFDELCNDRYGHQEIISDLKESCRERMNWLEKLKSLRPQPHKEIYQAAKHDLAIRFMNYLDENRPEGKMGLSNAECEDIDKAFKEGDWAKIMRYYEKYRSSWKPSEEQMEALRRAVNKLAKSDVADSVRLSIMFDNLKKLM